MNDNTFALNRIALHCIAITYKDFSCSIVYDMNFTPVITGGNVTKKTRYESDSLGFLKSLSDQLIAHILDGMHSVRNYMQYPVSLVLIYPNHCFNTMFAFFLHCIFLPAMPNEQVDAFHTGAWGFFLEPFDCVFYGHFLSFSASKS